MEIAIAEKKKAESGVPKKRNMFSAFAEALLRKIKKKTVNR